MFINRIKKLYRNVGLFLFSYGAIGRHIGLKIHTSKSSTLFRRTLFIDVVQLEERFIWDEEVTSSSLVQSTHGSDTKAVLLTCNEIVLGSIPTVSTIAGNA